MNDKQLEISERSLFIGRKYLILVFTLFCTTTSLYAKQELIELTNDDSKIIETKVRVTPEAADDEISTRLKNIYSATGWYDSVSIEVKEGVVFINGIAESEESIQWATDLANKTEAVVTVVNKMEVRQPDFFDFSPAISQLKKITKNFLRNLPFFFIGLILLVICFLVTRGVVKLLKWVMKGRVKSTLLRNLIARSAAIPVFLIGLYLILYLTGLSKLAATVIGGTGIIGLILGFAFRDIAENFLASVLVSIHRPFRINDLICVNQFTGYVQSVNTRATVLMTQEGNLIQIPNADIYKETIVNYTANPHTRDSFIVGIGYDDSITDAQSIAQEVLKSHSAILNEPEPLVLVDELAASTVNLRLLYWFDISKYSQIKVRSAVARIVKQSYDRAGISMPDEAREVVFPNGVPVEIIKQNSNQPSIPSPGKVNNADTTQAEGELISDADEIKKQSKSTNFLEDKHDILTK
ncbi:MAG: mechanosensitive ion channel domain-containing protein [Chlamydiota bacterium]|nr:mechanosensitive ion channel domain-containing protein [Chlamydiota bacterium]